MSKENIQSPQDHLSRLIKKRKNISKKMQNYPLEGDVKKFVILLKKATLLDDQISLLQEKISSDGPSPNIGQFSLNASKDLDGRRITRKKK